MTSLARGVYAIARTKRRRFLWCVWLSGEPVEAPFRAPDVWGGGARTEDEAKTLAEAAAGMPLQLIDGRWAGAWKRVRAGMKPFPSSNARAARVAPDRASEPIDPHVLLGVTTNATLAELKLAFRAKALEHHPDRGGDAEAFMAIKRAYDTLARRRQRPQKK